MKDVDQQGEKDPSQSQNRPTKGPRGMESVEWARWVGLLELLLLELRLWEIAVLEGSTKPGALEWLFGEGVERLLRYGRKVESCLARAEAGIGKEESFRAKGEGMPCREQGSSVPGTASSPGAASSSGATEERTQLSSVKEKSPEKWREREVWSDSLLAEGGGLQGELLDRLSRLRELEWAVRGVPTEIKGRLQPQIDEVVALIRRLVRWRWFGLSQGKGISCP
jgi:hypothetical protein